MSTSGAIMLGSLARQLHWWRVMHLSKNGLIRPVDRMESMTLIALAVAAAFGLIAALMVGSTAFAHVQDAAVLEQQQRHSVSATILPRDPGAPVMARWTDPDGRVVTGPIDQSQAPPPGAMSIMVDADGGSVQTIWLDDEGAVVPEPRSGTDAVTAGVAAAAMSTTIVAAFWFFVSLCVRRIADRRRFRLWDQDWAALDSPSRR
ncbi:hypothetical protein GIY30_15205 [Gordonia sp. HNM0687]|uniref:Transmembrane protein n=1 Tax=Gordonia mangrovi TaxID=2665643 RepID=A0A6L7GW01_9ACTN|nr:hypothetical protein [Gordonia mangrovi]MXP22688.1 hypothetical protein [Gordonia mangrovi]UVF77012.1 hypothetical protein NWF22_17005 [Gordonia mangrovi]